jgi:hypothetical protein
VDRERKAKAAGTSSASLRTVFAQRHIRELNRSEASEHFIRENNAEDQKGEPRELPEKMYAPGELRERHCRFLTIVLYQLSEKPKRSHGGPNRKYGHSEKTYQVKLGHEGKDLPHRSQIPAN